MAHSIQLRNIWLQCLQDNWELWEEKEKLWLVKIVLNGHPNRKLWHLSRTPTVWLEDHWHHDLTPPLKKYIDILNHSKVLNCYTEMIWYSDHKGKGKSTQKLSLYYWKIHQKIVFFCCWWIYTLTAWITWFELTPDFKIRLHSPITVFFISRTALTETLQCDLHGT